VNFTGSSFSGYRTILEFGDDSPWYGTQNGNVKLWPGIATPASLPTNQWVHTAYTWDGSSSKLYVNGSVVVQNTTVPPRGGVGMGIGTNSTDPTWQGTMDDVAVWGRALSAAEVQQHSQNRLTGDGIGDACDPCPGNADPACRPTTCIDADGDGYGIQGASNCSAGHPELFDCNDHDASVHPGAVDVPWDGVDNDCNGHADEPMQNVTSYQWDGNGNLRSAGATTYAWDARDRLVSGGYGYDSSNLRTKMGGQKVLLDGIEEARKYGTTELRYDHDPSRADGLLAQKTGAGKGYSVTDALGSVYAAVDSTGAEVSKYSYDAYGARMATTEGVATSWGFTGRRGDGASTLTYNRARYYATDIGRWLASDPAAEQLIPLVGNTVLGAQLANRYGYANSNPGNTTDRSGLLFGIELVPDVLLDLLEAQVLFPLTEYFEGNASLNMGYECPACRAGFVSGFAIVRDVLIYRIPLAVTGRDPAGVQRNPADPGHITQLTQKLTALIGAGADMTAFCAFPAARQLGLWYISIGAIDAANIIGRLSPPWYPRMPN